MHNFPEVPQDIAGLSLAQIDEFMAGIRAEGARLAAGGDITPDLAAAIATARQDYERLSTRKSELAEEQAAFQANADFLAQLSAEDEDETDTDDGADDSAGGDDEDETDADEDDADVDAEDKVPVGAGAPALSAVRPKSFSSTGEKAKPAAKAQAGPKIDVLTSTGLGDSAKAGSAYSSWGDLASDMLAVAKDINGNSSKRHTLAAIKGDYDDAHTLTEDILWNLNLFEQEEIKAALCAPPVPNYDIGCMNTTRRPVWNSAGRFAAPRGAVTIYPSPSLDDITTGYGVWTHLDDADPEAVKETCQTITCADSEAYYLYAVYRCITIKNMLAITFPELVEAYLNRLAAATARLAEQRLLNLMAAGSEAVGAPGLQYGGSTSITTTLLTLLSLHQERQRWDVDGGWHAWLPRWVRAAMKVDLYRQRNTAGGTRRFPTDAEIDGLVRSAGFNPTWFIDTPTWATTIPDVANGGGVMNVFPQQVDILVAPEGKLQFMDRGELRIGVTGNNIYRDNDSNTRNEFTMFFESFEGVVNTDSCPYYTLSMPACWTGVQIADVAIACDGTSEES